jgi:hypothetical protein
MTDKESRLFTEIKRMRKDIESSHITQLIPYINAKELVTNPRKHLLEHLYFIEMLSQDLLEENNGQN